MKTTVYRTEDYLETPEDVAAYLEAVLEDGDPQLISEALGDIARCAIGNLGWPLGAIDPAELCSIHGPLGAPRQVVAYMCRIDWECELGEALPSVPIYPSIDALKTDHPYVSECGIVEVEVRLRRIVDPGDVL